MGDCWSDRLRRRAAAVAAHTVDVGEFLAAQDCRSLSCGRKTYRMASTLYVAARSGRRWQSVELLCRQGMNSAVQMSTCVAVLPEPTLFCSQSGRSN